MDAPTGPVVVVEDEPFIQDVLRWIMEDEGYRVRAAADAREAVAQLADERPALILLDWMLPYGGGARVLEQARQLYSPPPPVLVISALDQIGDTARRSGAVDVIQKPFEIDKLLAAARRALRSPERMPSKASRRRRSGQDYSSVA